jgi:molecular chaperone GrpE
LPADLHGNFQSVSAELNSADDPGLTSLEAADDTSVPAEEEPSAGQDPAVASAGNGQEDSSLAELSAALRQVADLSERYHTRAEQREGVIDFLRSELDTLRRGERRGLIRPALAEMCRLRDDLLSQAETLPADFDATKAAGLLRSYAETLELALESNGVVTYAPGNGDKFDPRLHRRVGAEAAADPSMAGHVARVRRDGYLDIEANSPITPAEVTVFAPPRPAGGEVQ